MAETLLHYLPQVMFQICSPESGDVLTSSNFVIAASQSGNGHQFVVFICERHLGVTQYDIISPRPGLVAVSRNHQRLDTNGYC
jgi:hypothetical protein